MKVRGEVVIGIEWGCSLHVRVEGNYIINMSVPGLAREKYTHEVKFVGHKGRGFKKIAAVVGLLMLGLLIYACCNISSMRSQINDLRRMIGNYHHNNHNHNNHNNHNNHHGHNHHDDIHNHVHDDHKNHHHQRLRGNQNQHHEHPQPHHHCRDCQGSASTQQNSIGADLQERMASLDSFLKTRLPILEEKIDQISKELRSKQDISKRIFAKLNEFQTYLKPIIQSLKISNWF